MAEPTVARCPSELELDRWLLADRPADHAVPRHAADCARCAARLASAAEADAVVAPAVLAAHVADVLVRAEARRHRWDPAGWWADARVRWALVPAAAACLLIALVAVRVVPADPPGAEATWKGSDVALQVLAGGEPLGSGLNLAPGAVLTLRATVARPGFLALVSVEESGRVSRLLPTRGDRPTPVSPGVVTARGVVADAVGVERVYALFAERPFGTDEALRTLRTLPTASRTPEPSAAGDGPPRVAASWWFRHGRTTP